MAARGKLYILSGPSGVGKNTIINMLLDRHPRDLWFSVLATDRARREDDLPGQSYFFLEKSDFNNRCDIGDLWKCFNIHGGQYGILRKPILGHLSKGVNVITQLGVDGALRVKAAAPAAVLIFLMPPSKDELEHRIRARHTNDEMSIARRLRVAKREMEVGLAKFKFQVVNPTGHPEKAVREIEKIIYGK